MRIPPLLLTILMTLGIFAAAHHTSFWSLHLPFLNYLAFATGISGILVALLGFNTFLVSEASVNPLKMSNEEHLVTHGIYRYTRNPMYLGFLLFLFGVGFFVGNITALLLILLFVLYMNHYQIEPEETHLEEAFGEAFLEYKSRVRRWI